ncbi:MAG TPA: DMT family transporter [Candidatus Limnocylindria bacterium]|nr:DMT family transporter [Candidatus Limnocylindria bacterium]
MGRSLLLGSVLVLGAAALFGTLGFISRGASTAGLDTLPFVAWRAAVATVSLLAGVALLAARGGPGLPDPRRLTSRQRWALLGVCLAAALINLAIFAAFLRTTIAVALICFYTFPAMVTLAAVRLYGERLDRARLAALLLSSAGLLLVLLAPVIDTGRLEIDALGVGLALFAAVCQAAFLLLSGRGFRPFGSMDVSLYVVVGTLVVCLGLMLPLGGLDAFLLPLRQPEPWFWIVAGGLTGAAIPTVALLAGLGLVGPARTAILMTFEPVVGVLLAGLLLREQPAALQLVGGAAVLVAAVVLQVAPRAPVPSEPEYPHPL